MESKVDTCSKLMAEKGLSIAFAESATAGWLCSEFALAETSGQVLQGGLYLLQCESECLAAESAPRPDRRMHSGIHGSQQAMAYGLPALIPTDIHVAVTGLITPDRPVGTMFDFALVTIRLPALGRYSPAPAKRSSINRSGQPQNY